MLKYAFGTDRDWQWEVEKTLPEVYFWDKSKYSLER
jgi:hypothetical protein